MTHLDDNSLKKLIEYPNKLTRCIMQFLGTKDDHDRQAITLSDGAFHAEFFVIPKEEPHVREQKLREN